MMPNKDPIVRKEHHRNYMKNVWLKKPENREAHICRVRAVSKRRDAAAKQLLAEFRSGGCKQCGELDESCLVAHHIDPSEKEFNVSHAMRRSLKAIARELAKCICLCMNCHAKLHAGRITIPE